MVRELEHKISKSASKVPKDLETQPEKSVKKAANSGTADAEADDCNGEHMACDDAIVLPRNLKMGDLVKDGPLHSIISRSFDFVKANLHCDKLFPDHKDRTMLIRDSLVKAADEQQQPILRARIINVSDPLFFSALKSLVRHLKIDELFLF